MKVRMRVSIAGNPEPMYGLDDSFSFAPGDEVDLHPTLAEAWLANGHAEEIVSEPDTKKVKRSARSQESE